jgi:hypothetical protein
MPYSDEHKTFELAWAVFIANKETDDPFEAFKAGWQTAMYHCAQKLQDICDSSSQKETITTISNT